MLPIWRGTVMLPSNVKVVVGCESPQHRMQRGSNLEAMLIEILKTGTRQHHRRGSSSQPINVVRRRTMATKSAEVLGFSVGRLKQLRDRLETGVNQGEIPGAVAL